MQRLEVRALLSPLLGAAAEALPAVRVPRGGDIFVDEELEEDAFLRALEERLQQRVGDLAAAGDAAFLVLRVPQVDALARRLHDALEPKRDAETRLVQSWTIQPQLQRKVKMSSHIQVLKLSTILREVRRLRVHHAALAAGSGGEERTTPIEVDIFPSLRVIEVLHSHGSLLCNMHFFARQLQTMHIEHTPMAALRELLAPSPPAAEDLQRAAAWRRLETLELNCCGLPTVDASVNLLTAVRVLDLGWNEIKSFECALSTHTLESLSLCHNQLPSIPPLQALSRLRSLDLSVNEIQSLDGLQSLCQLEALDVSHNLINSISQVEILAELPHLRSLKLNHNPISRRADYRREIFFFLGSQLELDGQPWTIGELDSMKSSRVLRVNRTYIPDTSDEATVDFPKAAGLAAGESRTLKLVMEYPTLPPVDAVPANFVEILNPSLSSLSLQLSRQQSSSSDRNTTLNGSQRRDEDLSPDSSETEKINFGRSQRSVNDRSMQTVDDYFRVKSDSIVTAPTIIDDTEDDFSSEDDSDGTSSPNGRKRSRKYTTSDFMRDFEEEEAYVREGPPVDDFEVVLKARPEPSTDLSRSDSRGFENVRALLGAEESARRDLHFGIDGLAAKLEMKSRGWVETLFAPDLDPPHVVIRRRLQDVLSVGTLIETSGGRPSMLSLSLRCKNPAKLTTVTYKLDANELLVRFLNATLGQLHQPPRSQVTVCNCLHCGALSAYSREYVTHPAGCVQTYPLDLVVYACLLCSSSNVREISIDKLMALCESKGAALTVKTSLDADLAPSHLEQDGFYIEETPIDHSGASEVVLMSFNGIREVAADRQAPSAPLRTADELATDAWNAAIEAAMTATRS